MKGPERHVHQQQGKQDRQRAVGRALRQPKAQWRADDPRTGRQQCSLVAHDAIAQTHYGAQGGGQAHRQQTNGPGFGHAHAHAKNQERDGEYAAAGTGQREDHAHRKAQYQDGNHLGLLEQRFDFIGPPVQVSPAIHGP
ncbi:hypothetical protein D3C84_642500 [compost metagenome]